MTVLFKIKSNWETIPLEKNTTLLFNAVSSKRFRLEGQKELLLETFQLLDKYRSKKQLTEQITKKHPESDYKSVDAFLKKLEALGVIERFRSEKGLKKDYLLSLDRQLSYLSEFETALVSRYDYQAKIKKTKIAIIGLGHIGHWILMSLLVSGFTKFKLVDFDKVEKRNLPIQVLFSLDDRGKYKIDAVTNALKRKSSHLSCRGAIKKLEQISDVEKTINGYDIVVQCGDIPRVLLHRWITKACYNLKIPTLVVSSNRIGPFYLPGKTSCSGCLEEFLRKRFPEYDAVVDHAAKAELRGSPELAVLGALSGVLGGKEIVSQVLGINRPQSYNAVLSINPVTLKLEVISLPVQKNCQICGAHDEETR